MKPWTLEFPFRVRKSYKREFKLTINGNHHLMIFRGRRVDYLAAGNHYHTPAETSKVLDWIEETMMRVRIELKHP